MRYACIHRRRRQHSIRRMCHLLNVSRSGYHDWLRRSECAHSRRDRELRLLVRQIHLESNGVYGFFASLKRERCKRQTYKTREEAKADIFDYIEVYYNRNRRHSHLGGVSPETFERASF